MRNREKSAQIWGLTGGMGSGKSTVAKIFSELGFPVIDADQIAREIRNQSSVAQAAIEARFGTDDPIKLREIVFQDPLAKDSLEKILHPLIRAESQRQIDELSRTHSVIIYEATLLVETGRYQDFDGLIVVESPKESRIQRLLLRDHHCKIETLEKIIASQATDTERKKHADHMIINAGSIENLRDQVHSFIRQLK